MSMESLERTRSDPTRAGTPSPTEPGHELRRLGEFRLLRRLGEGGMGAVYLAYHEGLGKQVALKVLADNLASNQSYVDRFYREDKSGRLLNHPNIVRSYGAFQDRATNKHYLVLEYVDGPTAHALLDRFGRMSVGDAVHIALDVARALEHAHSRNVIHRDIKPDNILIARSGVSKLADLGLAKRMDEASHLTATRQGFGTSFYMPYEQALNAKHTDGRSDIYALGATLYHLVTGEVPFRGENHLEVVEKKERGEFQPASEINPAVPRILDQILARMLARQPWDRYQTASELIVDMERSRLSATVPSYADPDLALQDPWVRACLASSAQPTQPDLSQPAPAAETPTPPDSDPPQSETLWLLRYLARDGRWKRGRLTAEHLRQRIKDGRVPEGAEICSDAREGFQSLATHAEFRELFAASAAARAARARPHPPPPPSGRPTRAAARPIRSRLARFLPESWRSRPGPWLFAFLALLLSLLACLGLIYILFPAG
jgi:eukaryotic-like serine/threonine-protein kinase